MKFILKAKSVGSCGISVSFGYVKKVYASEFKEDNDYSVTHEESRAMVFELPEKGRIELISFLKSIEPHIEFEVIEK